MSSTTSCHNCLREVPIDSTWEEIIDGRTVYVCDNTDEECQILKPIIAAQRVEQARRKRVRKLQQEYWYSKMTRDEKKTFDRLPPFSALVKVPYYGDTCRPYASMPAVFVAPSTRKTYSYGASHETGLPVWGYEIEEVRDAILDVYDRVVAGEEFELQKTFERQPFLARMRRRLICLRSSQRPKQKRSPLCRRLLFRLKRLARSRLLTTAMMIST